MKRLRAIWRWIMGEFEIAPGWPTREPRAVLEAEFSESTASMLRGLPKIANTEGRKV